MPIPMTTEDAIEYIGSTVGRLFDLTVLIAEYVVPIEDAPQREYVKQQREYSDYYHSLQDIADALESDS